MGKQALTPKPQIIVGLLAFATVNTLLLIQVRAGTPAVSLEPESAAVTAPAAKVVSTSASGDSLVKFSSGFQANCIDRPSACGYPDATNTGVPAGITLINSGSVTVTQNGAVVQNLNITNGQIYIRANNVTIKNTRITTCDYYPIRYDDGYTGLTVMDTEINSTCDISTAGISFNHYTARRVNVHGSADGFKGDSDVVVEDSYIHDLAITRDSHNDGLQTTGGDNVTFRHNTCDVGAGAVCIQFGSSNRNWQVTDNLLSSGGWTLNGGNGTKNSTFTNNRFRRGLGYGPASVPAATNTWSGNYYDDNGEAITNH